MSESQTRTPAVMVCASLDEYAACALDLDELERVLKRPVCPAFDAIVADGLECLPYAGSPSYPTLRGNTAHELVSACARMAARRFTAHGRYCGVAEGDDAALVAAVFALVNQRRLLVYQQLEMLKAQLEQMQGAGSALLFFSPERLAATGLDRIRDLFFDRRAGVCRRWGVMSGSAAQLATWVAKSRYRPTPRDPVMQYWWFGEHPFPTVPGEPGLAIHQPSNASRDLAGQAVRLAMFAGHGRSYCAMDGNLCSREPSPPSSDSGCVDGMECILRFLHPDWQRLSARELKCDIVVLDTCSGGNVLADPEPGASLATHLLEGAALAVVTPYRSSLLTPANAFRIWELARRGCDVGEIARTMNRDAVQRFDVFPPFVLFGDPELQPFAHEGVLPVEVACQETGEPGWRIVLPRPSQAVICYRCRDEKLAERAREGELGVDVPSALARDTLVQILHGRRADETEILIVWLRIPDAPVVVTLTSRIPFGPDLQERVERTLRMAAEVKLIEGAPTGGTTPGSREAGAAPAAAPVEALTQQVAQVARYLAPRSGSFLRPQTYMALTSAETAVLELLPPTERAILDQLRGRRTSLMATLATSVGVAFEREIEVAVPCHRCGGKVQRCLYRAGRTPPQARWRDECERCSFLCDVPEKTPQPRLTAWGTMSRGQPTRFDLEVRHDGTHAVEMQSVLMVEKSPAVPGSFGINPGSACATVAPGSPAMVSFAVIPDALVPLHVYRVVAFFMLDAALCSAEAMVRVVPGAAAPGASPSS